MLGEYHSDNITSDEYNAFLLDNFGAAAPAVAEYYSLSAFSASPIPGFTAMSTIITDVSYFCPAYRALNLAAHNGVPAFTYLFSHSPTCLWYLNLFPPEALPLVQAGHTSEIQFAFGNLDHLPLPNGTCNFDPAERAISKALVAAWTAMAETGNPSTPDLTWPLWNATSSLGINIVNSTAIGVVNYTTCEFWDVIEKSLNFTGSSATSNATSNATVTSTSPTASATYTVTGAGGNIPHTGSLTVALFVLLGGLTTYL